MELASLLPDAWRALLKEELAEGYLGQLQGFLDRERAAHAVYPPAPQLFEALRRTPPEAVRVVLLGQDPYHGPGQAHGLCFSVPAGVKPPPSLRNIFRELSADLDVAPPRDGDLGAWADRGVLLLNTVLSVRAGQAASHQGKGWERFTDGIIRAVQRGPRGLVFVLWGKPAQRKRALIDLARHRVVEGPHPSPLSAHRGFFGSRPFSQVNERLRELGAEPIDWRL